ncbi:MAG: MgtC/SapB family protein [Bacteroidota bacterium]
MFDYFQKLYPLFASEDLLLIFLSIVIGLIIGAEREYKNKTAGLRTLMLVSVGSCTFTILSIKIGVANPDRLAANIITGIGFLGAGAIFKDENKINGVTTACTIWVTASLGMCIGSGHIYLGLLSTAIVLFVLWNLVALERWIDKAHKIRTYKITTTYEADTISRFEKIFAGFNLKSSKLLQAKTDEKITINWRIAGNKKQHDKLAAFLLDDVSIHRIEI